MIHVNSVINNNGDDQIRVHLTKEVNENLQDEVENKTARIASRTPLRNKKQYTFV